MKHTVIDPTKYGVSFSLKQCRNFGVDPRRCLDWLINQGWQRFRLMTYWDELEAVQGAYDFTALDWQLQRIAKAGGTVTLCLGIKQPRWPEYHWPTWTKNLSQDEITTALLAYIEKVIEHIKNRGEIISYQLENEALLNNFGEHIVIDRRRLRAEFKLVKSLDPSRPVIMSTSNGWGIPLRRPVPDIVGFSLYTTMHQHGRYNHTIQRPWLHRLRAFLIRTVLRRQVFIHELQLEPWGPKAIWEMTEAEQAESMSPEHITYNLAFAKRTKLYPVDIWGAEWWYWRLICKDQTTSSVVLKSVV